MPETSEDSPTTRSHDYRPAPPEAQSALSIWIVRIELAAALLVGGSLLAYGAYRNLPDNRPVRIKSAQMASFSIPADAALASAADDSGDFTKGQVLYLQTCTACHGQRGQGMPHQGVNLRVSKFIATLSDRSLAAFIKQGRTAMDPKNSTGLLMPPRGGNPALDDDSLEHIVAFLRQIQKEEVAQTSQSERASVGD
jgi:disulfide bond formation protein DsbB